MPRYLAIACLFVFAVSATAVDKESPILKKGDTLIFLGDSITEGGTGNPKGYVRLIKAKLEKEYAGLGVKVIGAGVGGNVVPDLQRRLEKDVLALKPTIVVVYIGINDVWRGRSNPRNATPKDQYEAGLKDVIGRIQKAGARVVLCTPSVIGEKKAGANAFDANLDAYSEISRNVAKETGATVCDLRKACVAFLQTNNPDDKDKDVLTYDTVHLNDAGNALVAETILKLIEPK